MKSGSHVDIDDTKIVKEKLKKKQSSNITITVFEKLFLINRLSFGHVLGSNWGSKKPLGDVWGVFWRPLKSVLGAFGGSLGRLRGILGAWPRKMP